MWLTNAIKSHKMIPFYSTAIVSYTSRISRPRVSIYGDGGTKTVN